MHATSQEQRIFFARKAVCPSNNLRFNREHCAQGRRQMTQSFHMPSLLRSVDPTLDFTECQRQQKQRR